MTDLEMAAVEYRDATRAWRADGCPLIGPTKNRARDAHLLLCAEAMKFATPDTVMCMDCGTTGIPNNPAAIGAHDDVCCSRSRRSEP